MRPMSVGDFIKQIRDKHDGKGHWSRLAVAERAGISDSYLYQLEENLNTKPSPAILRKLAPALKITYEELMEAAGYIPPEKQKKIIEIPIRGECPADKFNFAFEEIINTIEINYNQVKDKSAFGLRVKGDCLRDIGIYNGDIVIVSPNAEFKNGDIVIARVGEECTMKKYYKASDNVVFLQPCNHDYEPIILDKSKGEVEIIGKVIKALKSF